MLESTLSVVIPEPRSHDQNANVLTTQIIRPLQKSLRNTKLYLVFFYGQEKMKALKLVQKDENLSSHINLLKLYFKHFVALNKYRYIPYKNSRD